MYLKLDIKEALSLLIFNEVLVAALTVEIGAVGLDLDDSVCDRVNDLVVVRGKENVALEGGKTVVYGGNGFKIEVVCGLGEKKHA